MNATKTKVYALTSEEMMVYIERQIDAARKEVNNSDTGSTNQYMWMGAIQMLNNIKYDLCEQPSSLRSTKK